MNERVVGIIALLISVSYLLLGIFIGFGERFFTLMWFFGAIGGLGISKLRK